jgi:UDP-N-acetyl-D-mannosaminuronate dehydrogenase
MKICVIGLGTIGTPTINYIHEHGMQVYGYDLVKKSIAAIETYTDWTLVPKPDVYVVTVSSDRVEDVCKMISEKGKNSLVSIESTVRTGTCRKISNTLGLRTLVHCPERYWVDEPITHGIRQPRVIGAINERSLKKGLEFYQALNIPLHVCSSIEVAETCKIAENAYRFVQIAFAEELRRICENKGVLFDDLRVACNTKWNIEILEARDGIYGKCLPKDTRYLRNVSDNVQTPLIRGAILTDEIYKKWIKTLKRKAHQAI